MPKEPRHFHLPVIRKAPVRCTPVSKLIRRMIVGYRRTVRNLRSKQAELYTSNMEELPRKRRETVQLVRQAVGMGRHAYVLVNNRAERTAPLTVEGLTEMLRD